MKILHINSVCGIRSTGRICTDLADTLEKDNHICKVAFGRETVPEKYKKYAVRIGNSGSVKIDAILTRLFDNAGFNSICATKKFIKWVKEFDPDVIHLHNIHGYYINIKILFDYLKKSGKPVIWTLHDCWPFTGHCSHFVTVGCEKWKTGCFSCSKRKAYPSSLLFDFSKQNYQKKKDLFTSLDNMTIITPSKWLGDLVKESFLGKYPVEVIPNGIDLEVFKPTESDFKEKNNLLDKKIVLGVASAWGKGKGLYDFVKLSEMLGDSYKVVLVGLKPDQIAQMPENILCISRTNNAKELAEIYTAADVFVNPTYADNYPTVNIEALACGTPVITYRTGGSVESVVEDCIIEQGDVEALKNKIISGDYKCRNDLMLSKEDMLKQYVEIYNETLNRGI